MPLERDLGAGGQGEPLFGELLPSPNLHLPSIVYSFSLIIAVHTLRIPGLPDPLPYLLK